MSKTLSTSAVFKLHQEIYQLVAAFSQAKIKIGLELAQRLKIIKDNNLFKRLDESAYPNFVSYLDSLGLKYKTAMEVIGIYESYILTGGYTIEELSHIPYHILTIWKPHFFEKQEGQYQLTQPKEKLEEMIQSKEHLTIEDNKQYRREIESGSHQHEMEEFRYIKCKICGLKEFKGKYANHQSKF